MDPNERRRFDTLESEVRSLREWRIAHEATTAPLIVLLQALDGKVTELTLSRARLSGAFAAASLLGGCAAFVLSWLASLISGS